MEKITDVVNQNVQNTVKKFQDTKNKEYEKTQKQINELVTLNKHQSETGDTINREINELNMKINIFKGSDPRYGKTSEKGIKQKHKRKWKATPAD
jgi:hypothetical protein